MRRRKIILLLVLCAATLIMFSACSKTQSNNDFSVGGIVKTDADFFEILILVNGKQTDYSLDSSGRFYISHLKSGDVISFSKEGYSFNSYTVGGFSVDDVEIVGTKRRYTVLAYYDESQGVVEGAGTYEYGETATLIVTPAEHFENFGIYEKDDCLSTESEYTFTVTSDRVFVVKFSKKKYPITIEKTSEDCVVSAPESAAFGEEITVSASDDENFVFAYFEVDGTKYYDKTLKYVINSINTIIKAVFSERLSKPVISFDGRCIAIAENEHAERYEVYIDGRLSFTTSTSGRFPLAEHSVSDGTHKVLVKVFGDGYGENESEINIEYVRPYDTPKNVGLLIRDGKVYFVFQKVLAAIDYEVSMNGRIIDTAELEKATSGETVLLCVDTLFTECGEYRFEVRAIGDRPESDLSDAVKYLFKGSLSEPVCNIEDGVLTVSHEMNVKFVVEINGVNVTDKLENNSLVLADVLENGILTAKIKITAILDGYKPSTVEIIYNTEE